jgi:ligand-binding SRPBCC domain-containing protein
MKTHQFDSTLVLPAPLERVFPFFADAAHLDAITPPWLHFSIITPLPVEMKAGAILDHRLKVRGVSLSWQTRIQLWEPPCRFVDEQIRGPYRRWIHTHEFEEAREGTLMRDHVEYATPFDFLLHKLVVRPDIQRIFDFRAAALTEHFHRP